MNVERISSIAAMTGYGHTEVRKSLDAGQESQESKDARFDKLSDEERKKVIPVYSSKGEIIEYDSHGRHLDTFA